jgi:hypothetical protein
VLFFQRDPTLTPSVMPKAATTYTYVLALKWVLNYARNFEEALSDQRGFRADQFDLFAVSLSRAPLFVAQEDKNLALG